MTEPGWYTDPNNANQQRWWDGNAWGEQTAPGVAQPTTASTPQTDPQAGQQTSPGAVEQPGMGQPAGQPVMQPAAQAYTEQGSYTGGYNPYDQTAQNPAPTYAGPVTKKKSPVGLIIGIIVIVLVLGVGGCGALLVVGANNAHQKNIQNVEQEAVSKMNTRLGNYGVTVSGVKCGDINFTVGNVTKCTATVDGTSLPVDITITEVTDDGATFNIANTKAIFKTERIVGLLTERLGLEPGDLACNTPGAVFTLAIGDSITCDIAGGNTSLKITADDVDGNTTVVTVPR